MGKLISGVPFTLISVSTIFHDGGIEFENYGNKYVWRELLALELNISLLL